MSDALRVDVHGGTATIAQIAHVAGNVNLAIGELDLAGLRRLLNAQPATFDELFELVTDPAAVFAAVSRRSAADGLEPLPRAGDDFGALLRDRLRAHRALLVTGRGGIGKTHEVAAVAREMVEARGYVVAIARPNAEHRLPHLGALPAEVANARALWVFDDLHLRVGAGGGAALAQAIGALCARLDADMPARWLLLGTARDDPSARARLALAGPGADWGPCGRVAVPEFADTTLQQALRGLAERCGVLLDAALVPALVANSDRTLRTLTSNVALAARRKVALDATSWRPAQADSWRARFDDVAAVHVLAVDVFGAVALLRAARVPPRRAYVEALAGSDAGRTTDALIEASLLGERDGAIDAYADEALADCLGEAAAPRLDAARLDTIGRVLVRHAPREHVNDLAVFGLRRVIDDDWALAVDVLDAAVERGADHRGLFLGRGLARGALGDARGAIDDLSRSIEHDGESAMALSQRSRAYQLEGDPDAALADLLRAVELDPGYGPAHTALAMQWVLRDELGRSVEHIDLAIAAGDDVPIGRMLRARSLAGLGQRLEQALEDADIAQAALGDLSILRRARAFALAKLGRDARAAVAAALEVDPDDADLLLYHAVYTMADGNPAAARDVLMRLDERGVLPTLGLSCLGQAHLRLDEPGPAVAALTRYLDRKPADAEARAMRLEARWRSGDMPGVIEDCDALQPSAPARDPALWTRRGRALGRLGRHAEGAADVARAAELDPQNPELLVELVILSSRAGQTPTARDAWRRLGATDCPAADREVARANLRYAEGDWQDALASARDTLAAQATPAAQLDVALAELFGGRTDAALLTLRGVTGLDAATRQAGQDELEFWRQRHPKAVDPAAARAFSDALRGP